MNSTDFRFGFRIVGKTCEPRRLVDAGAAFAAYASCDPKAEVHREAYLSAFQFGPDFRHHLESTDSTAGYAGPCWSPFTWFDLDAEELAYALADAGGLAAFLVEQYGIDPGNLLLFCSGSKGFHVGLPTALWSPPPSVDFQRTARRFAEHVAELAAVTIDTGVYDRVRAFRAPNSRHPKTGLHKRRLTFDELLGPLDAILELAKTPAPFDVPTCSTTSNQAAADWQAAAALVANESEAKAARRANSNGSPVLNRSTLDYIRNGADRGDRHRLLFSAAANLAEFACTPALAVALLEESALDSGLAPKDVRRGIECGLAAVGTTPTQQAAPVPTQAAPDGSAVNELPEADTSDSGSSHGQSCQQETRATTPTASDLAALWNRPQERELPPDPPPLMSLPPGAVGSGSLDKPCRCGSTEYVEVPIPEGRTRRDCRKCGRFAGWGKWSEGGTP